jgi:hypothetical protein
VTTEDGRTLSITNDRIGVLHRDGTISFNVRDGSPTFRGRIQLHRDGLWRDTRTDKTRDIGNDITKAALAADKLTQLIVAEHATIVSKERIQELAFASEINSIVT